MSSKIETKYNQITYLNENIFEIGDNKNKLMEEKYDNIYCNCCYCNSCFNSIIYIINL